MVGDHVDHPAMLHHVVAVGDRRGEAEILLHQQHGEAAVLDLADGAADLLHDDRGEALGRLVQQQHFRSGAQDAAIASICCSPPDSRVPCAVAARSFRLGNSV